MPPRAGCEVCGKADTSVVAFLLVCATCEKAWHHKCVNPPISARKLLAMIKASNDNNLAEGVESWECPGCSVPSRSTGPPKVASSQISKSGSLSGKDDANRPTSTRIDHPILRTEDRLIYVDTGVSQASTSLSPNELPTVQTRRHSAEARPAISSGVTEEFIDLTLDESPQVTLVTNRNTTLPKELLPGPPIASTSATASASTVTTHSRNSTRNSSRAASALPSASGSHLSSAPPPPDSGQSSAVLGSPAPLPVELESLFEIHFQSQNSLRNALRNVVRRAEQRAVAGQTPRRPRKVKATKVSRGAGKGLVYFDAQEWESGSRTA